MSKIKKFVNDTVIYGLSTIISRVLNFLLTPLFVSQFKPAVYGIFTNLYAWSSMVNALLAFGMETTYFRFLDKVKPNLKHKVFNASFFITLISAVLFLLIVFSFAEPIGLWLSENPKLNPDYIRFTKYFAVILCADALAVVPFAKLRAEGRPIHYSFLKIINIAILIVFNLFFLILLPKLIQQSDAWMQFAEPWFKEGWLGYVFISNLIASVVTLLLLLPEILSFRFSLDLPLIRQMLNYSFPILIANISFIINEHLDKMLFPKLLPGDQGEIDLGIYGAVSKIAIFLYLFVTAFRLGAEPFFFSYAKNENARTVYAKIMEYFVIAMVLVMVGICANLEWLKYFVRGQGIQQEVYWSGLYIVPILLLNFVLLGVYMNLSIWYKLSDQTRYAVYIAGIGALLTLILSFILIPIYSYLGAVLVTTVAYLVMIIISYIWGQKNYPIPYNLKKNILYIFLGTLLSWICYSLLDSNVWLSNGVLILFGLGIAFSERENLQTILRKRKE